MYARSEVTNMHAGQWLSPVSGYRWRQLRIGLSPAAAKAWAVAGGS